MTNRSATRALGGVAAQVSQAMGSFALQLVAARYLGLDGLGRFAVLYGIIVLATAISSGFVGDSLTVLDRGAAPVRAGLQWWLATLGVGIGTLSAIAALALGFLSPGTGALFGLATLAFLVEDAIRRLLMANLLFWRIVIVDAVSMVVALTVVGAGLAADRISLPVLLAGLAAGQAVAMVAGWRLLPAGERVLVRMRGAAVGAVAAYGSWRALQQAVRAGTLALVRVICLLVVTQAAVGGLEAARIYMAPAVLAVTGVSSYLFASYAASAEATPRQLVSLADRTVVKLLAGVLTFGAVGVAAVPLLAPVLTGGEYDLSLVAVAGWAAYAAATAGVTPYGQLASVRGRHVAVFTYRLADSLCSLVGIYVVVSSTGSVSWAPLVMAGCSLLGGLAIRELVIKRDLLAPDRVVGGGAPR